MSFLNLTSKLQLEKFEKEYQQFNEIVNQDGDLYKEQRELDEADDEEQYHKTTSIMYVKADEYDIYEKAFKRKGFSVERKGEIAYISDTEACQWDCFCKLNIFYYAHDDEMITPKRLYDKKLISSGKYTAWKGLFMESIFSDFFDVERKVYKIRGMEELLRNPKTCALILKKYICTEEDIEEDSIWKVVEKVVKADEDCKLTEGEKNLITSCILGSSLYKREAEYLSPERKRTIRVEKKEHKLRVNKNELKHKLEDICKSCESSEEIKMDVEGNKEEREIKFPQYLAPIIAAICEYHESNPFFIKTNIWKKKINVKLLSGIGQDSEYCKKPSKDYAVMEAYCDYREELEHIAEKERFLEKYEAFCYQLIYKILYQGNRMTDGKSDDYEKKKYIKYYIVEQLIGMELFEAETTIIYERVSGEWDEKSFYKNHRVLGDILGEIFSFGGAITKVKLAESILEEYFTRHHEMTGLRRESKEEREKWNTGWRNIREALMKEIQHKDLLFRLRERIYVEDILKGEKEIPIGNFRNSLSPKDVICGGRVEKNRQGNSTEGIEKYFKRYDAKAEKINDIRKKRNTLRRKELENLAMNEISADEKRNAIKKWVICNSILEEMLPKFEYVSEEK